MKKETVIYISKWLFIILFAYTALSKFLDYNTFVFQMRRAPLPLIHSIAPLLGWLIPVIETVLVIGLLVHRFSVSAQIASVGLLLIFELYIAGMLLSGFPLPCSCGGIISKMSWKQHLLFNGFFIGIGLISIIQFKKYKYSLVKTGEKNKDLFSA